MDSVITTFYYVKDRIITTIVRYVNRLLSRPIERNEGEMPLLEAAEPKASDDLLQAILLEKIINGLSQLSSTQHVKVLKIVEEMLQERRCNGDTHIDVQLELGDGDNSNIQATNKEYEQIENGADPHVQQMN